jgi:hypothetical protein
MIQGTAGIIKTDLRTESDGTLTIATAIINTSFVLVPTDKSPNSILGGSCVLTQNHLPKKIKKCKNAHRKRKCRPCPSILCAPIIL